MVNYRHAKMKEIIGAMNSSVLAVHRNRCLLVRNRNADCLRCANVCTTGAISLDDEGVRVDPDKCIGCGTCASVCPTCCLEARNPGDSELFDRARDALADTGNAAFACESAIRLACQRLSLSEGSSLALADATPIIGITCLGRAEESLLVETAAHGARKIILVCGNCDSCEHVSGGKLSEEICLSAASLLEAMGSRCAVERVSVARAAIIPDAETRLTPKAPGLAEDAETTAGHRQPEPCSRAVSAEPGARTALRKGERLGFTPEFVRVQEDGTLPHFVPERRLRLFNSLKAIGAAHVESVETRLWGQVDINVDLCRSCRMCTVFCPTGAVSRFEGAGGVFGVEHRSALCVQCRMCEAICPEGAISVSSEVSLEDFLSGRKFRFEMKPIGWSPGGETSIASRMARFIKTDTFQDPQATIKPGDISAQRDYAFSRDAKRSAIRGEQH